MASVCDEIVAIIVEAFGLAGYTISYDWDAITDFRFIMYNKRGLVFIECVRTNSFICSLKMKNGVIAVSPMDNRPTIYIHMADPNSFNELVKSIISLK
ncbi:MAG: hypothetical protein QXU32_00815 [Nitrososphaerales archaeon]